MQLIVNRLHYPVTALGGGRRVGLWVQGCSVGCAGCMSRDTWGSEGKRVGVDEIVDFCKDVALTGVDGITISGGEPFEQPRALAQLLEALHAWRKEHAPDFDLLCYSGLSWSKLQREFADIVSLLDAIVPEPFVHTRPSGNGRFGSSNQRLICLSKLGELRHGNAQDSRRRFQIVAESGRIRFIGIPGNGDMERLRDAAAKLGLSMARVSWDG